MRNLMKIAGLFYFFFNICLVVKADLTLYPLSIKLSSEKIEYRQDEPIPFKFCIYNNSTSKTIPIYFSHPENGSKKTMYLRCFRLVNKRTSDEQYETKNLALDASLFTSMPKIMWLKPGDSLNLSMTLNDSLNYYKSTPFHHTFGSPILPKTLLSDSVYFNVFYDPTSVLEANKYFCFENSTHSECPPGLIPIPSTGCMSSYLLLKINQNFLKQLNSNRSYYDSIAHSINLTKNTVARCHANCSFCEQVETNNWKIVKNRIGNYIEGHSDDIIQNCSVNDWLLSHKCVAYAYPVGAILASLPSYGSIGIGFITPTGIQDMDGSMRFGTIYRGRSRLNKLFYLLGRRHPFVKDCDASTVTFLALTPIDSCIKVDGYEWTIKARVQWLEEQLQQKSLPIPPRDYFTAYFGISQEDLSFIDHHLEHNPEAFLQHCIRTKNDMGLCFLLPYPNNPLRKKILNALVDMKSKKCLPYLLLLSKKTSGNSELDQHIALTILTIV